jgi:membrane protein involved in colicin uptake
VNEPKTVMFNPTDHMALLEQGRTVLTDANDLVVDSDVMYNEAGELRAQLKTSIKRIEAAKESLLKPVRELDRAIRSLFDPALKNREAADSALEAKQITYRRRKEEEAAAARRAAEEAARKERERLEREAAAARAKAEQEAAEARRKAAEAEAARQKAEAEGNRRAAAAAAAQAAKLNEQAQQKTDAGERAAAELSERAQLASVAAAPVVEAPKAKGESVRRPWKARIKNPDALLASIAKNPAAYRHLVEFNEGALNKMAGAQQKGLEAVLDGIEVYQDMVLGQKAA